METSIISFVHFGLLNITRFTFGFLDPYSSPTPCVLVDPSLTFRKHKSQ